MQINKMQIETAEQVLKDALKKKKTKIAQIAYQADIAKNKKQIDAFMAKGVELREIAKELKRTLEKNSKLTINLEEEYHSFIGSLPKSINDYENNKCIIKVKGSGYNNDLGNYEPDMSKQEEEVNQFILGLKLGTALMADLQALLAKINK